MTKRKPTTERRPARQPSDAARSAAEASELLGFGPNPSNLCASDRLKVDLVSTLRLVIDHAGEMALEGGTADIGRLITAVEQLTRLLPKAATEPAQTREDPRKALLDLILTMRERDEIADRAEEPSLREQVAVLQAENVRLRAALAAKAGVPSPESSPPAPADNVVPLPRPASAAPAPAAPASYDYDANSDWKSYVNSDGSISPTPFGGSRKYWGPV